jgi:hypothetical protein
MPEDLTVLLEKLKIADPETWQQIDIGKANRLPLFDVSQDIVQGCIQRACEKKAWIWTISKEDSQSPEALEGTPYGAIIFDDEINILVEDIYRDSPASAILTAYLAAMES